MPLASMASTSCSARELHHVDALELEGDPFVFHDAVHQVFHQVGNAGTLAQVLVKCVIRRMLVGGATLGQCYQSQQGG